MHRSTFFDHEAWHLIPVKPAVEASFHRWNLVVIWSLTFVVLGVFAMGLTPQTGHAYSPAHKVSLKIDKNPADLDHARKSDCELGRSSAGSGQASRSHRNGSGDRR